MYLNNGIALYCVIMSADNLAIQNIFLRVTKKIPAHSPRDYLPKNFFGVIMKLLHIGQTIECYTIYDSEFKNNPDWGYFYLLQFN